MHCPFTIFAIPYQPDRGVPERLGDVTLYCCDSSHLIASGDKGRKAYRRAGLNLGIRSEQVVNGCTANRCSNCYARTDQRIVDQLGHRVVACGLGVVEQYPYRARVGWVFAIECTRDA